VDIWGIQRSIIAVVNGSTCRRKAGLSADSWQMTATNDAESRSAGWDAHGDLRETVAAR
jgi:hypothetical protein